MRPDVILADAGLATGLIALALAERQPEARILMLEQAPHPSDAHTWSFHAPDLDDHWHRRIAPAVRAQWSEQEVRFPTHARVLRAGYASADGAGLARLLGQLPQLTLGFNATITALDANGVSLGRDRIDAPCVIDGRGASASRHLVTGYSLPRAAQVADYVAGSTLTSQAVYDTFRAFALVRFYRLPEPLPERFYAGWLTPMDRLCIVTGKPPIPIRDALRCLREAPLQKEDR